MGHSKCTMVTMNRHHFTNSITFPCCHEVGELLLLLVLFSSLDCLLSSNLPPYFKGLNSWFLHIYLHLPPLDLGEDKKSSKFGARGWTVERLGGRSHFEITKNSSRSSHFRPGPQL